MFIVGLIGYLEGNASNIWILIKTVILFMSMVLSYILASSMNKDYALASQGDKMDIEQITKADRNACHALCRKGKARATLRRLSSTVLWSRIIFG